MSLLPFQRLNSSPFATPPHTSPPHCNNEDEEDQVYKGSPPHYMDGLCSCWLFNICNAHGLFGHSKRIGLAITSERSSLPTLQQYTGFHIDGASNELQIAAFIKKASVFKLPIEREANILDTNFIFIGPGTGVAPFRGFLQYLSEKIKESEVKENVVKNHMVTNVCVMRGLPMHPVFRKSGQAPQSMLGDVSLEETKKKRKSSAERVLFFGCRQRDHDFLYKEDWNAFLEDNVLTEFHTAFSREGFNKVYVQHQIREYANAQKLAQLIMKKNAYIMVCGDAKTMAVDVENTIVEILALHSTMTMEESKKYVRKLQATGRYVQDIWSSVPLLNNDFLPIP